MYSAIYFETGFRTGYKVASVNIDLDEYYLLKIYFLQ